MVATVIVLDVAKFRDQFSEFCNGAEYPDAKIQSAWDQATCYVSDRNYGWINGRKREQVLLYLTAHILKIGKIIGEGDTPGVVSSATIDKVSVTLEPPPVGDAWDWWLQTTPYGGQMLALLQALSVGGMYTGGSPELAAFRGVGGRFGGC